MPVARETAAPHRGFTHKPGEFTLSATVWSPNATSLGNANVVVESIGSAVTPSSLLSRAHGVEVFEGKSDRIDHQSNRAQLPALCCSKRWRVVLV